MLLAIVHFQITGKTKLSLLFIALSSLSISLFVCLSDPFLHIWDEQVHAVVAKNMINKPFKPTLFVNPVLPFNYKIWVANNVWLHKQPLFLWQIALSFKLFGVSTLSLRLPSILMTALMIFPIYRIGKIISGNQAGIFAAILLSGSNFIYQLNSGRMHTDHNDIAFLFYVTLSIWAWFEMDDSEKRYWIIFIGIFSGAAILNKWLVGLLVYFAWGLNILLFKDNRKKIFSYLEIVGSLMITAIVVLPWQIYILIMYPKESRYELEFNSLHFFEAIENHTGNFMYHLNKIETLYGTNFKYVIIVSIVIFLVSKIKLKYKIALLSWVLIVYFFYSVASTKMPAFTIIVAPIIYIIVGQAIYQLIFWLDSKQAKSIINKITLNIISISIVFFMFIHFLNYDGLSLKNRELYFKNCQLNLKSTIVYKALPDKFNSKEIMVYNCRNFDYFKILFHTNFRSRAGIPIQNHLRLLKEKKIKIVVFDNEKLPDYVLNDTTIAKIRSQVWQTDFGEEIEIYY